MPAFPAILGTFQASYYSPVKLTTLHSTHRAVSESRTDPTLAFNDQHARLLFEQPTEAAQENFSTKGAMSAEPETAVSQVPVIKSRGAKAPAPFVKRKTYVGIRGARPLAVTARTGGARTLTARGFSLKTRSSSSQVARMAAPTAVTTAAESTTIGKLTTPAGTIIIDPPMVQPAPGWPAGAPNVWPDGSSATTSMQANGDVTTDIWFPVGITAVAFYAVGQSDVLNTCSVTISISAYSYEAPATPSTLTQTVNSCSGNGQDFAAFFGFAVQEADADDLVRLEVRVTTGVAPTEDDAIPSAGVILSDFMLSTSRPLSEC